MVHCCVIGCGNKTKLSPSVNFHRFPNKTKKSELYSKWIIKINRKNFIPNKNTYVCSVHFLEEDYSATTRIKEKLMPDYKTQRMLSENAVPSLCLTGDCSDSPAAKKRKTSTYVTMKERLETISSPVESRNSDHKSGNFNHSLINITSSSINREIDVQCEMGLEIFRSTVGTSRADFTSVDAAVQCELGIEIYRNIVQDPKLDTYTNFEILPNSESTKEEQYEHEDLITYNCSRSMKVEEINSEEKCIVCI